MTVRYLGGKSRLGKKIAAILNPMLEGGAPYYEPFCGACNVAMHIRAERRYLSDAHPQLIAMWKAVQNGWVPPDTVTEADYAAAKRGELPPELTAFIGFGCSFGGKWFGGYARGGDDYTANTKNSIARKLPRVIAAEFKCADYTALSIPADAVVYCDPPYASTTGYCGVGRFESARFWAWVRGLSETGARVVISEYIAPDDFVCIAEFPTKLEMRSASGRSSRIERLFTYAKARN